MNWENLKEALLRRSFRYLSFSTLQKYTRNTASTEGPRDALGQLKFCQLLHNCTKIAFYKACNRCMTLKFSQGRQNSRYAIGDISSPISSS